MIAGRYRVMIPDEGCLRLGAIYALVRQESPKNARELLGRLSDAMGELDFTPHQFPVVRLRAMREASIGSGSSCPSRSSIRSTKAFES